VLEGNLTVYYAFTASASGVYDVWVYDWGLGAWRRVASNVYSGGLEEGVVYLGDALWAINPANGSLALRLNVSSSSSFTLSVDQLNIWYSGYSFEARDCFIVGAGGSSLVDVYTLVSVGGGVALNRTHVLEAYSVFDGRSDVAFDSSTNLTLLVNATGVYGALLTQEPHFQLVTLACNGGGDYVKAEAYNGLLLVVHGGSYCLVDVGSGSVLAQGVLPEGSIGEYSATALDKASGLAYILAETSSGYSVLLAFDFNSHSMAKIADIKVARVIGMTYQGGLLWIALEGGGFYAINPSNGAVVRQYYPLLPAIPLGPGDRLEAYAGYLLLVRGDGSNDLLVIPIP